MMKEEPTEFENESNVGCEKKKQSRSAPRFLD